MDAVEVIRGNGHRFWKLDNSSVPENEFKDDDADAKEIDKKIESGDELSELVDEAIQRKLSLEERDKLV